MTETKPENFVTVDLDKREAVARFASGVEYRIDPFLTVELTQPKSPDNCQRVVYRQLHTVLNRQYECKVYKDIDEAAYDDQLPSIAKLLLQVLEGVPIL